MRDGRRQSQPTSIRGRAHHQVRVIRPASRCPCSPRSPQWSHLRDAGGDPIAHDVVLPRVAAHSHQEDPMTIGPIQAFVIGFPDSDLFEGRIAEELARLSDVGQIRIIDAVFVAARRRRRCRRQRLRSRRRPTGRAARRGRRPGRAGYRRRGGRGGRRRARRLRRRGRTHRAEVVAASLLDELPDGSSALVLAIEHLWAVPLRDAVRDAGGLVLGHRLLTPEELIAFGMVLGARDRARSCRGGGRRHRVTPARTSTMRRTHHRVGGTT